MDLITSTSALPMTRRQPWYEARYGQQLQRQKYGQRPTIHGTTYGQIHRNVYKSRKLELCWTTSIARMMSSRTSRPPRRPSITTTGSVDSESHKICPSCDRELYASDRSIMRCRGWDSAGKPRTLIKMCQNRACNMKKKMKKKTERRENEKHEKQEHHDVD